MQTLFTNHLLLFWVAIGILVLSFAIACAKPVRKSFAYRLRVIGMGVVLAIVVLFLPFSEQDILYSIITALQASMMGAGYDEIIPKVIHLAAQPVGSFMYGYCLFLEILMLLAPICLGGILISFSDVLRTRASYYYKKHFYEAMYFSQLNENSFALAQSIVTESAHKKVFIVFCNFSTEETAMHLIRAAKKEDFILLPDSECDKINQTARKATFFEIDEDADLNLDRTQKLLSSFGGSKSIAKNIKIYLFAEQTGAEIVINSIDKKGVLVFIVDKPICLAYDLMFNAPLYQALQRTKNNKISALVVGAGDLGTEITKAIAWCGQLGDVYQLSIQVIDKNATQLQKKFQLDYPELVQNSCDIKFHQADVSTIDFKAALDAFCADVNYIVVCLGDSEQGVKTALYLREYYLCAEERVENKPRIHLFAPNSMKHTYLSALKIKNKKDSVYYDILPFGERKAFYSREKILCSEVEKLAHNAQAFYTGEQDLQTVLDSYNQNEIDKRSSRANVIHIKYKLFLLGYEMVPVLHEFTAQEQQDAQDNLELAKAQLQDPAVLRKIAKIEHLRWNAFQTAEGYKGASVVQALHYATQTGNHKNAMAKLHACICSWDELDEVSAAFNTDFKGYDIGFAREMLNMIGAQADAAINVSGCKYILVKIKEDVI